MPWHLEQDHPDCGSGEWAVVKDDDGSVEGCHPTEDDAQEQLAALNAAENQAGETPMSRIYLRGYVERADEGDDGPIRFVAATEGQKGDGLNLKMDRVDLARFRANPVIGYGHDYFGRDSLPIGRSRETTVDGKRLLTDIEFDPGDQFAQEVERKVRGGFLNAVSVGFEAFDIDRNGVPDRWNLFEVSVVPIGMDPNALAEARDLAARALEVRAGKVLSAGNKQKVQDAIAALNALLESAADDDDDGRAAEPDPEPDPEPAAAPGREAARARLDQFG